MTVKKSKKYSSMNQSIERALAILDAFDQSHPAWGAKDLSARLKLNQSTVHRLMETLEYYGMLEQNPVTRKYQIGLHAFEIGSRYLASNLLERCSPPYLETLAEKLKNSVHLAYLDTVTAEIVMINSIAGEGMIRVFSEIGSRSPCHLTALGKAIMACITNEKLDSIINKIHFKAYTEHSLVSAEALKQDLELTRRRGYAVDDRESDARVRCVAAPVFNHQGKVIAAVSVSGLAEDLAAKNLSSIGAEVVAAAKAISNKMGYTKSIGAYLAQESNHASGC